MRYVLAVLTCLIWPLLPARFRALWPWELPADDGVLAQTSAYVHMIASVLLWGVVFIAYEKAYSLKVAGLIADDRGSGEVGLLTWYGMVCFFSFFFTPWGMLLSVYIVDSAVRLIHALGTGEPMGSFFLAAPLWVAGKLADRAKEGQMTARYGRAGLPDRIVVQGEGLVVRATRPHEEWNALYTYSHRGVLYKLHSFCEDAEGSRRCFLYRFEPWPDRETVRRLVAL